MKHSFIAPRPKKLISTELKLVFFFFAITIVMLSGTYAFLVFKTYDFDRERREVADREAALNRAIGAMEQRIVTIEAEVKMAEQITTENMVMKESIRNLFDLVPDGITLSRADLEADALVLYGTTPNKETYQYMLEAPLRSIFHQTYTSFYPIENGWYRFVSTNRLEDESGEESE